jgi:hypothetical protein
MGDAGPPESGLDAWLPKNKHDIYAIGVQVRDFRLIPLLACLYQLTCVLRRSASTATLLLWFQVC